MKHFPFTILLGLSIVAFAQKQGNVWYFGRGAGVDFSSGVPVGISGGLTGLNPAFHQEGTACISDSAGKLLFYTDGRTIWNRFHQVMSGGMNLAGGTSATQSGIIVPWPGSDSLFYVFTNDEFQSYDPGQTHKGLQYTIVNICANDGRGAVDANRKNILLMDSSTEKLAAIRNIAGNGYWIFGHKHFSDAFYAWHISSLGVSSPVIQHVGSFHGLQGPGSAIGQMKISSAGDKIAVAVGNSTPAYVELFDFDITNGVLGNPILIPDNTSGSRYGIEFSPDGTKLYVGDAGNGDIFQYDLLAGGGHADSIIKSKYVIANLFAYGIAGMQLGPDGRIYVVIGGKDCLAAIANANAKASGASFIDSAVCLTGPNSHTLPSFIAGYKYGNGLNPCGINGKAISVKAACAGLCTGAASVQVTGAFAPLQYRWLPGNHTTMALDSVCAGVYHVQVTDAAGQVFTDSVIIGNRALPVVNLPDTLPPFCAGDSAELCAPAGFVSYIWNTGETGQCTFVHLAGNTWVHATDNNGCSAQSSSTRTSVFPAPAISVAINGDTLTCFGAVNVQWYLNGVAITGATNSVLVATAPGSYSVTNTGINGCMASASGIIIGTDINTTLPERVLVYPNPLVDGRCEIKTPAEWLNAQMHVFNTHGQLIFSKLAQGINTQIDIEQPAGIYYLQVGALGTTRLYKLVKL